MSNNHHDLAQTQKRAWSDQIEILKNVLIAYRGLIVFEFSIPRMGRRIDVVLIIEGVVFVLEFKVGEKEFGSNAIDQVWDYALDLKNFHATSHHALIVPVVVATEAPNYKFESLPECSKDRVMPPLRTNKYGIQNLMEVVLTKIRGNQGDNLDWLDGTYSPTPTIIQAAIALYNKHSVVDVTRKDAAEESFQHTVRSISSVIEDAKQNRRKAICFITGVPGAGKTLVGLEIATQSLDHQTSETGVYLSGNGPLVAVLREALTRDRVKREQEAGVTVKKGRVRSEVKVFIQNVHNFRDDGLVEPLSAPKDHVVIFDEAQRAWNHAQTATFMSQKKNRPDFTFSEPEFLISCMDRHEDWAVVVCLVGGGQEINKGEGGISEWLDAIKRTFPHWDVHISSQLHDSEYFAGGALRELESKKNTYINNGLHLSVSMRSFRQENVSLLIKKLLDLELSEAKELYQTVKRNYPIMLTRNLNAAKDWIRSTARGTERYGIVVSSQAQRLKPHAIDVKSPVNPVDWFLNEKSDVRSSYFMEDVATEFYVQGLELDWTCVVWDADFRYEKKEWKTFKFVGDSWQNIKKTERKKYLKNAYRVLLTRARQGMVIVVPDGECNDLTRLPAFYDVTYNYLKAVGFEEVH